MQRMQMKSLEQPDEIRTLPKTKLDIINIGDVTLMRATFEPGWKWSECIKPSAKTNSCEVPHINYVLSGRLKVMMDDGTVKEMKPGDFAVIPPGHDAEVVGNENCVMLDISGGRIYGK